ncbi:hypothetical protein C0992_011750 [Termitomyces sp. T32_za158]|nr:hypothetical protein C0992_011750 [Termitomyces sp. T32_za158]
MASDPPHPVVAFIIGLAIILLASVLNAAGLNLTKLDHVRTSAVPKSARKEDWKRPLWLLGMFLYIMSQLLGSTLALEYMRAEYVAPLGSSSLIFNFLFARFLVGTPGTIIVILGVIGIVAFGSINSGLSSQTDVTHITYLWRRGGWLGFFFFMSGALVILLIFVERLDAVLTSRSDLSATPVANSDIPLASRDTLPNGNSRIRAANSSQWRISSFIRSLLDAIRTLRATWASLMVWVTGRLEVWTAPQDDKQIAWTLGILWACCGGDLAGGTLVFAKAIVKLLSGSLSKQNPGNQFGHAAPIFTIILLAVTAVLQIICLNRGLKVYDSTLVVPVFYGIYTATGFLDSLIFNNEVDSYKGWTLFLIFLSILILISGVVLLTHKKPEHTSSVPVIASRTARKGKTDVEEGRSGHESESEREVLWTLGEDGDSDENGVAHLEEEDPDVDHHQHPISVVGDKRDGKGKDADRVKVKGKGRSVSWKVNTRDEEGVGLIGEDDDEGTSIPYGSSLNRPSTIESRRSDQYQDDDEFGNWERGAAPQR